MKITKIIITILFACMALSIRADVPNKVIRGNFTRESVLSGTLKAERAEYFVVPRTNNWQIQLKWMPPEGTMVKPGDPVVRFDSSSTTNSIENTRLSIQEKLESKKQKNADYNLKKMELDVTLEEAEITYKKAKVDAEIPKGLESNYKYDQNQLTLQKAEKNLEKARVAKTASLAALKADIETIDINIAEERAKLAKEEKTLAGLTLHATTTGTLVYGENRFQGGKKIQIGDNVMATSTVATVPDKNSLYVEAWTTETGVLKLKPNLEVEFFMDARPDKAFKGSILSVSNNAEKKDSWGNAHYFRVFIKPEKIDTDFMKPGMSVKCVLRTATMENVLLVPVQMTAYRDNDIYCRPKGEEPLKLLPLGINYFYLAVQAGGPLKKGDLLEPIDQMEILQPENPIAQTKAAAQGKSDTKENTGSQETSEALEKPGRDDKSGKHDKSSEGKKHGTEKKTHKKSVPKADNKSAAAGVEVTK